MGLAALLNETFIHRKLFASKFALLKKVLCENKAGNEERL